jgi:hypothetical protein
MGDYDDRQVLEEGFTLRDGLSWFVAFYWLTSPGG